jgi:hypothetical protein
VSSALGQLADRGEVAREPDGGWLLTGAPVGIPTEEAARIVRVRRFSGAGVAAGADHDGLPVTGRIGELHQALSEVRLESRRRREEFAATREQTRALMERLHTGRDARDADPNGG